MYTRYIKIIITDNNYSVNYVGIGNLQIYDHLNNKILITNDMLSVSSTYLTYTKDRILDSDNTTAWCCNNESPCWIIIDLQKIIDISKIRFFGYGTVAGQAPYDFNINFSNDNNEYTQVTNVYHQSTSNTWYEVSYDTSSAILFLIKQDNQYYSIKPEFYQNGQFTPLTLSGGDKPNDDDYNNQGFDDINNLCTKYNTENYVANGATLDDGKLFTFDMPNNIKNINNIE